jgi:putative transposase
MPRNPRIIIPDVPHHIVQRGDHKNQVFFCPDDFELYLDLLANYSEKHRFDLVGYCLMSNHVHLVGIPSSVDSLVNVTRDTHQKYSSLLNRKMGKTGHNWQERPGVIACDDPHAIASTCYSEYNPVSAGMVRNPGDYMWSSARAHLGLCKWPSFLDSRWWKSSFTFKEWIAYHESYDHRMDSIIREATLRGKPLGSEEFMAMAENYYGIVRSNQRRGRPLKSTCLQSGPVISDKLILPVQQLH